MKATKFCKQKCYFVTIFCPADDQVAYELILLCAKGTPEQYLTNRKRKSKSWLLATQRIIRLLILTRFLCSENENTVFKDPKDRQVKHYPNTKAVTLSNVSG